MHAYDFHIDNIILSHHNSLFIRACAQRAHENRAHSFSARINRSRPTIFAVSSEQYFSFIKMVCLCSHKNTLRRRRQRRRRWRWRWRRRGRKYGIVLCDLFPTAIVCQRADILFTHFVGFNGYYLWIASHLKWNRVRTRNGKQIGWMNEWKWEKHKNGAMIGTERERQRRSNK